MPTHVIVTKKTSRFFCWRAGFPFVVVTANSCSGNVVQGAFSGSPCTTTVTLICSIKLPLQSLPGAQKG